MTNDTITSKLAKVTKELQQCTLNLYLYTYTYVINIYTAYIHRLYLCMCIYMCVYIHIQK